MRQFHLTHFFILFFGILLITSCRDDDKNSTDTDYSKGTWIVNQGKFQDGTGTLTFYDGEKAIQNVFQKENDGRVLGNIVQSIIKVGNKYYIAVNNADKVVVADAQTMKFLKEISIDFPRYFATDGSKLYVSGWNKDFSTGAVYEIDTQNDVVKNIVNLPKTPEGMTISSDKLYVTQTDVSFQSKEIVIINTNNNMIIKTLEVCDNPQTAITDATNQVWVICRGHSDWQDPTNNTKGALVKINGETIVDQTNNMEGSYMALNGNKTVLYISNGKTTSRFRVPLIDEIEQVSNVSNNGIGIHPVTNKLFLSMSDFFTRGETIIYDFDKMHADKIESGVGASFIYFAE